MNRQEKLDLYNSINVDQIADITISKFNVPGYPYRDLKQEAMLAAWKSLDSYDYTKGTLNTYLTKVVQNKTIVLFKKSMRKKRIKVKCVDPEYFDSFIDEEVNIEEEICEIESIEAMKKIVGKVRESLDGVERDIVDCYLEPDLVPINKYKMKNVSSHAIYKHLNISVSSYLKAIKKIKKTLKPVQRIFP